MTARRSSSDPPTVLGVGWAFVDLLVQLSRYPVEDTKVSVPRIHYDIGGPVVRALLTVSALAPACRSALVASIGSDLLGRLIQEKLREHEVKLLMEPSPVWATRKSIVWLAAEDGTRTVTYEASESPSYELPPAATDMLRSARDVLHLDGRDPLAAMQAIELANQVGARILVDAGSPKEGIDKLMASAHTVIAPVATLRTIVGDTRSSPVAVARELLSPNCHRVFVTAGGNEQMWAVSRGETLSLHPFKVSTIDSNGAGDVFAGGVLAGMLNSWPLQQTLYFAAGAAALKCTAMGNSYLPGFEQVRNFIIKHVETLDI